MFRPTTAARPPSTSNQVKLSAAYNTVYLSIPS